MKSKAQIVSIISFGCKVNTYEATCIAEDFSHDYQIVSHFTAKASVFVVNSCTVTARAGAKCRQTIRKILRLKKDNPGIKLVVTGCLANLEAEEIKKLGAVDYVTSDKSQIFDLLHHRPACPTSAGYIEQMTSKMYGRTRAFVKIQDGCNFFCAYCIIPYARGVPTFRSVAKVLEQIKLLVANGYREVVLGGINIGLYHADGHNLQDLLWAIEQIPQLEAIRISSIEPQHLHSIWGFITRSKKLAHHLHIPLQSGSDKTLQSMGRRYSRQEFAQIVLDLCKIDPYFAIGCDVIVGFPGESQADFQECYDFITDLPIAYLHTFPYSLRAGTRAAQMSGHLPKKVKTERAKALAQLSQQKKHQFALMLIKSKTPLVAQLEQTKGAYTTGVSDRYLSVYIDNLPADGRVVKVVPEQICEDGVWGKLAR